MQQSFLDTYPDMMFYLIALLYKMMLLRKAEFLLQTSVECVPGFPLQAIASRSSLVQALIIGIQSPGALGHGFPMS